MSKLNTSRTSFAVAFKRSESGKLDWFRMRVDWSMLLFVLLLLEAARDKLPVVPIRELLRLFR
jgi:hypothetical protein